MVISIFYALGFQLMQTKSAEMQLLDEISCLQHKKQRESDDILTLTPQYVIALNNLVKATLTTLLTEVPEV